MGAATVLLAVLVAVGMASAFPAGARPPAGSAAAGAVRAERVLVLSLPRLTWAMVDEHRPPALGALLERASVASLSVRTLGPRTTLGEGYATLGAGNRATTEPLSAGVAVEPDASFEGSTGADVYRRRTARPPDGAVLHLGIGETRRANDALLYGAEVGALGEALRRAGRRGAVIANADVVRSSGAVELHREAALAVMDADGRVAGGNVDGLVVSDPAAPFGLRTDTEAVVDAFAAAWAGNDVVLVEAGDLERADAYLPYTTRDGRRAATAAAVAGADDLVARLLDTVDLERDLVIVVSPAAPSAREHLTVAAFAGPGVEPGPARSATTRRAAFVTLPDIAPTVLAALGVAVPDEMTGTAMTAADGAVPAPSRLARVDEVARFRDRAVGPVSVTYIVFQVVSYGLAVVALCVGRVRRLARAVVLMALVTLAVPPVTFLSRLVPYDRLGVPGYVLAVFAVATVVALAAARLARRHLLLPPLVLVTTVLVVLLVDVVTGAHLQLNTVLGYSPIVAGRFAGYGNLAFALLAMAAIVVATGAWGMAASRPDATPLDRRPSRRFLVALAALFVVTVVADGHPSLGSDVGGVLATVPAFAVVVLVLGGWSVSWRRAALIGAATMVVLAVFAALDLSRPEDQRTHLGRLAARVGEGGAGTVIRRKVEANVSILTSSVWTYVIPVAFAFLAFLTWRRSGFLGRLQRRVPGLRACLLGALVTGTLGFALNDSGVAVPAMMFGILLPYLTYLVLRTEPAVEAPP